jgi:RND family efflux transporter MFP subunit
LADERSNLLEQLRIDRGDALPARSGRAWLWWTGGAVALLGLVGFGWLTFANTDAVAVTLVTATATGAAGAPQRGSILDASGYVVARRQATVSAKITGRVVEVLIEEGQRVELDEVVARLDDANARAALAQSEAQRAQALASLEAARVAFENAGPTFERNREQFAREVISAQAFDTAKASYDVARTALDVAERGLGVAEAVLAVAQRNLADTVVRAPFAGVVTVKAAQEGEMVSPISAGGGFTRTGIGTIVDMESLEIEVDVSENFINRVVPEQDVTIKLNAYPDWDIPGHVIAIVPTADRAKATVRVRIGFDAKDDRILPEMGLRVSFLTGAGDTEPQQPAVAVVVPPEAIQANGETGIAFIVRDDKVERRVVRLGARTGAGQVVLSGVSPGARLAIGDPQLLADGTRIRASE